jgi:CRP-like cAMP-binding protein
VEEGIAGICILQERGWRRWIQGLWARYKNDGEIIIRQGDIGDCMYVIQEGQVEVIVEQGDREVQLAVRGKGELFREMAIFEKERRLATVRAVGTVR